jgi:predicted TIM-barrel fold metal-dependent hydrolase
MEDMIIASVDDHVIEPPTMFDQHLSKADRGKAPQYVRDQDGNGSWLWAHEGKQTFNVGLNAVVGRPKEEYGMEPMNIDQMRKGTWDAKEHIDDMNAMGVQTALMFPTFAGFDGGWFWDAKDKANAERVVRAYNDWHVLEWCGPYPGRYFASGVLPLWDVDATVAEMKRLAKMGCRSVFFPANPAAKDRLPSVHHDQWDPMWALANDEGFVFNCHIGTGTAPQANSDLSPISAWITSMPMAIATDAADLLHLRALLKYPNLKIALSEGGIGWVPYLLERADFTYKHHGPWVRAEFGGKLPSEVFREHFLTCFIDDKFGCMNYESVGEDLISYECDYPHSDCTWPNVAEDLWDNVKDLPDRVINKITHQNAYRFFGMDPVARFGADACTVGALRKLAAAVPVDTSTRSYDGKDARIEGDWAKPVTAQDVAATFVKRQPS